MLIANKKVLCEVPPEAPRATGLSLGAEASQKLIKLKVLVGNVDALRALQSDDDLMVRDESFVYIRQPPASWVKTAQVELEGKVGVLVALSDVVAMEHPAWCYVPLVHDFSGYTVSSGGGGGESASASASAPSVGPTTIIGGVAG